MKLPVDLVNRPQAFFRCLAVVTVATALGACRDEPRPLKTYVHAMDQAATTTDPAHAATIYDSFLTKNLYDTLYSYQYLARPYRLKPNLAVAMPEVSVDGLTHTIQIKRNVRFSDSPAFSQGTGRELVAADVVYSLKRHFDPETRSQGAWLWRDKIAGLDEWADNGADYDAPVAGLEALDRYTVQIRLSRPYPQLVFTLATAFSAIVPREAVEHFGIELGRHPVGSGPFVLEQFDATRAVMSARSDFRREPVDLDAEGFDPKLHAGLGLESIQGRAPPFVDQLEIHFIQEPSSRWAALQTGRDIHFAIAPNEAVSEALLDIADTSGRPALKEPFALKFHAATELETAVLFQAFNFDHPSFGHGSTSADRERNRALRCAIVKAFDWPEHNRRIYNGMARIYPGIIPPMVPEFDAGLGRESVERDVEGAVRLLAAHGWSADQLPPIDFGVPAGATQRMIFEQFRGFMTDIGYPEDKVVLRQFASFGALNQAWKESRLPLVNKGWGLDYPDAENVLQLFYGPNRTPGSNDGNFRDDEYDRLFEQAATMLSGPERTAIYRRLNEILIDQCAAITGLSRTRLMMWDRDAIAFPDRMMSGGFYLRYVDVIQR